MQTPENVIDPRNKQTTKTRIMTTLAFVIMHIVCWLLEIYSNQVFTFLLISTLIVVSLDLWEYNKPTNTKTPRAIFSGVFHAIFIFLLPKYSLLATCMSFIAFWAGMQNFTKSQEIFYLILSNLGGWASCYFYFQYYRIPADDDELKYIKMFFEESPLIYQLMVGVVLCCGLSNLALIEKENQTRARTVYEQNLLALNKDLQDTNQKLHNTNKELQEALQAKENFILRFSHEIRNPLNSLLGNVELCQESAENDQSKQMLNKAKISGEILLQLLNNILDTAKVSAGRLDLSMHHQDIRGFLERAWGVCLEIIRQKKLYGCLAVNANVPERIEFDSHRLMQILINVVSNASKFTEHGYVKVFVDFKEGTEMRAEDMKPMHADTYEKADNGQTLIDELNQLEFSEYPEYTYDALSPTKKRFAEEKESFSKPTASKVSGSFQGNAMAQGPKEGYLRLEIVDTGCGIKKKDLDSLFTKFSQVSDESSERQIGAGLGLWITKEIVNQMSGKIEIFSVPNHGTTLVLVLKCKTSVSIPKIQSQDKVNAIESSASTPIQRAMVVEDIPYNQEINFKFLQKCGVQEISLTSNGKEAVDLYLKKGEEYFDFILMDIDMPIMDGKTATKLIRQYETENGWRPTPLVFLTAYSESKMQKELLDPQGVFKADGFLSKPVSQEIMRRTLADMAARLQQYKRKALQSVTRYHHRKLPRGFDFGVDRLVLLIEDDPANLSVISKMLSKCGFQPLEALNAKQAFELYEKHYKDLHLVLADCEMPIMDGIEITHEIIERHKKAKREQNLLIYGITGLAMSEHKMKCYDAGMRGLLEKPITLVALRSFLMDGN